MDETVNSGARLNHIAVAVTDLEAALSFYRDALGLQLDRVEDVPEEKSTVAFLPLGDSEIELVQPTSADTGLARWLVKHGAGMHHLAIQVESLDATLQRLKQHGIELTNPEPRQKPDGTRYAFVHPKSAFGVLVELYEVGRQ